MVTFLSIPIPLFIPALVDGVVEDIWLTIRQKILTHLQYVSMSEYDLLGSGAVSSKMMTDIASVMKMLIGSIGNVAKQ